jgi:hypothetical protein
MIVDVDLLTLFKLCDTDSPIERPAIFYKESGNLYTFLSFKGPLYIRCKVKKTDIISTYAASSNLPKEQLTEVALQRFTEIYLNRAIPILDMQV